MCRHRLLRLAIKSLLSQTLHIFLLFSDSSYTCLQNVNNIKLALTHPSDCELQWSAVLFAKNIFLHLIWIFFCKFSHCTCITVSHSLGCRSGVPTMYSCQIIIVVLHDLNKAERSHFWLILGSQTFRLILILLIKCNCTCVNFTMLFITWTLCLYQPR